MISPFNILLLTMPSQQFKTLARAATWEKQRESAFWLIPVHRDDWELLGMFWNRQYYFDKVLPFGLRPAPCIFNQLSDTIEWILLNRFSISFVYHILDDFLTVEPLCPNPPLDSLCQASLSKIDRDLLNSEYSNLCIQNQGALSNYSGHGIILDSGKMEARLPVDKVEQIKGVLSNFQSRRSTTLQEL